MLNDAVLNTGLNDEPQGIFDNEVVSEVVSDKIREQEHLIKELQPKIENFLSVIDREIEANNTITDLLGYMAAKSMSEDEIAVEVKARGKYIDYLAVLKTNLVLSLEEVKKNGK